MINISKISRANAIAKGCKDLENPETIEKDKPIKGKSLKIK